MLVFTPNTSKKCNTFYQEVMPTMYNFTKGWGGQPKLMKYILFMNKDQFHCDGITNIKYFQFT